MKIKNVFLILLIVTMGVSSLVGCSKKEVTKETADVERTKDDGGVDKVATEEIKSEENEETTLSLLIDTDISMAGFEAVAELAKEKLGIVIEVEYRVGGADGDNIVKTRLASGDMADLCTYNSGALLNALNPAEYFIDISNEDFVSRLDDTYRKTVTVDGATYGVPQTSSQAGAILYNKPMYEKYNLEVPKTWDEFMENCRILKKAGETAIIGSFADAWTAQVLYLGDNYNVLSADPSFPKDFEAGKAKYATSEAGLKSFSKLEQTQTFYNLDYLATSYDDGCDMIVNGAGAHWVMLTQSLSNIYQLYGDQVNDIGVFGIPGDVPEDQGLTVWMPSSMYGNKNSDKIDDILRFMAFYVSDEALDAYTAEILPDGPYCIKGYELPENSYKAVANDMQAYFDAGKTAVALEFLTAVKGSNCPAICQAVASGQMTDKEAATAYDSDCLKQAVQLGLDWE